MSIFDFLYGEKNIVQKTYENQTEAKLNLNETTQYNTYHDPAASQAPFNPDDIFRKFGSYATYEEMLKDDQVNVCMSMKKDLLIGNGWNIQSDDPMHDDIKKELTIMLKEDPLISFDESLEDIATAFDFGFSISEKVFTVRNDNIATLKYIKTRHPGSWEIHRDDFGNVTAYMNDINGKQTKIDESAIIHYVNNGKFQNPYGDSDLRAAYDAWIAKRHVIRFFSVFLERAAGATPVAKVDSKAPANVKDRVYDMIRRLQSKTAMVVPKEFEIEFLEAKNKGEVYDRAINIFNMMIGRALLTPDLLGISGSETHGGSYSLGQKHYELFLTHIEKRRGSLERLINNKIIKPLVIWNWGFVENYPKFKFKPLTEEDKQEYAKIWIELVKTSTFKPPLEHINYFNEIVGFPKLEVLEVPEKPVNPFNPFNPNEKKQEEPEEQEKKKEFARAYNKPIGEYDKKVNYEIIKNQLDGSRDALIERLKPIVKSIWDDLADQVEKKKILEKKKIDKIDALKVRNLKQLQIALKSALREFWQLSSITANNELFKQNFSTNLITDEIIELLEKETFAFVGDWEYLVSKTARQTVANALKDGLPISSVVDMYTTNGYIDSMVSLERFSRTKFTEVMNNARLQTFEKTEVVSAYQYSAILDDRTSDICNALHGTIYKAGTQPTPPMHFNCRSLLVPITKFEEWEPDKVIVTTSKDNITTVKTKNGVGNVGKGFSYK